MNANNLNIIFFGTPEFAAVILKELIQSPYRPSLVVTAPDKPVGRKQEITPPPVKILAQQEKIKLIQPEKLDATTLASGQPGAYHLAIVAAYGKLLPKEVIEGPKYGVLNVHPSLLPRWRGPSPIQYALLEGDQETGVSIMLIDEEVDHGPVLAARRTRIANRKVTAGELANELANLAAELLIETIPKWIAGKTEPTAQVEENATYSRILTKEDGHIVWSRSAEEIERQIRAFTPWPGSFTFWREKRLQILQGSALYLSAGKPLAPAQTFLYQEGYFAVQTGMGLFVIERLQLAGKNEMTIKEFLNGYAEIIGSALA